MHEAVFARLVARGEARYSAFLSYRAASDAPIARLLFDELNHRLFDELDHRIAPRICRN